LKKLLPATLNKIIIKKKKINNQKGKENKKLHKKPSVKLKK